MKFGMYCPKYICFKVLQTSRHFPPHLKNVFTLPCETSCLHFIGRRQRRYWCVYVPSLTFCLLDVPGLCNASHIFHGRVWYHVLSLRYARIQSLGLILTSRLPLCQISFPSHPPLLSVIWYVALTWVTMEKITYSVTHPAYLMCREPKPLL